MLGEDRKVTDPPLPPPGLGHVKKANLVLTELLPATEETVQPSYLHSAFTCLAAPGGLLLLFRYSADAKSL